MQHWLGINPASLPLVNIYSIYSLIFRVWRQKRMALFEAVIQPSDADILLDVGGYPGTWITRKQIVKRIDCLNTHTLGWGDAASPDHRISTMLGDGCKLDMEDASYDIVFSNSVIERVGDWDKQRAFAAEARRVGKKLWIQTPAYECPLEPHFLAPFVHWLPVRVRRCIVRWFTPWGWITKPTQDKIDEVIYYTRLLGKPQIQELFPDCTIITERLFGVFPKSYIAYRTGNGPKRI